MLLARRLLPEAPNHKLGTLIAYTGLPVAGDFHRAEADAEMAAHLTVYLERRLQQRFGLTAVPHALLSKLQTTPKAQLQRCIERYCAQCA